MTIVDRGFVVVLEYIVRKPGSYIADLKRGEDNEDVDGNRQYGQTGRP